MRLEVWLLLLCGCSTLGVTVRHNSVCMTSLYIRSFGRTAKQCVRAVQKHIVEAVSDISSSIFDLEDCPRAPKVGFGYDKKLATTLMRHCSIAYVVNEERIHRWTCGLCMHHFPNFTLQAIVEAESKELLAYVGYDANIVPGGGVILAFRGTTTLPDGKRDLENWATNFDFVPEELPDDLQRDNATWTGKVHGGFLGGYLALRHGVTSHTRKLMAEHHSASLLITGHSLGGALATIAAVDMSDLNPTIYTFGAPMVGSECFCRYFDLNVPRSIRVAHPQDFVTKVPGYILGFQHAERLAVDRCCGGDHLTYQGVPISTD